MTDVKTFTESEVEIIRRLDRIETKLDEISTHDDRISKLERKAAGYDTILKLGAPAWSLILLVIGWVLNRL